MDTAEVVTIETEEIVTTITVKTSVPDTTTAVHLETVITSDATETPSSSVTTASIKTEPLN